MRIRHLKLIYTEPTDAILSAFDKCTHIRKPSGKHTNISSKDDVMMLVDNLQEEELYKTVPGRKYVAFPDIKGTMSTTMHCALKQCLAAILLVE